MVNFPRCGYLEIGYNCTMADDDEYMGNGASEKGSCYTVSEMIGHWCDKWFFFGVETCGASGDPDFFNFDSCDGRLHYFLNLSKTTI